MDVRFDKCVLRQGSFELRADFELVSDTSYAIIGPSGGGKSTLLAALAGFIHPVSGRIYVGGRDVTDMQPAERSVSLLFQDHNLFPHLDVKANVGLALRPDLRLNADEKDAVKAALCKVGLAGLGDDYPGTLSGGQQQRAALARALLSKRPVLALDEPFAALGPALRADMLKLVTELHRELGTTLLLVSHHPQDALLLGGETVLVANGVAQAPVPTKTLFSAPPPALRSYLGETAPTK